MKTNPWEAYLIEAHHKAPSMTPLAFARYRDESGRTSYETLANSLDSLDKAPGQILDLACGDGYLIPFLLKKVKSECRILGVDMSADELAVARHNLASHANVSFQVGNARQLPLAASSCDAILCHMAFMLMNEVDAVVAELKRVLKPGGLFAAVVSSSPKENDLFLEIQKLIRQKVDSTIPEIRFSTGDSRTRSPEGLNNLFNASSGFNSVESFQDINLQVKDTPDENWSLWRHMYFVTMLPGDEQENLRRKIVALLKTATDSTGKVSFNFPLRSFVVRKQK